MFDGALADSKGAEISLDTENLPDVCSGWQRGVFELAYYSPTWPRARIDGPHSYWQNKKDRASPSNGQTSARADCFPSCFGCRLEAQERLKHYRR